MLDYLDVLAELHHALRPRTYLEIGVFQGDSFRLAENVARRVGVDPEPELAPDDPCLAHVEIMTSDAFFASSRPRELFGDRAVEMIFIDGMHLFEYALRDFANAEAIAGPASLIVLHDCLPRDGETASRQRTTGHWTGDVWKLPACLLEERPDLELAIVDVPPSGLCLVRGLDPADTRLRLQYKRLVEKYGQLEFTDWEARRADVLERTTRTIESRLWSKAKQLDARLEAAEAESAELRAALLESQAELRAVLFESQAEVESIISSRSWRLTAPLRRGAAVVRKKGGDRETRPGSTRDPGDPPR